MRGSISIASTCLIICSVFALALMFPAQEACATNGVFASGSGTSADPFIITNIWELQNMSADLNAHYALGNKIDASITSEWNDGQGFEPIGTGTNRFTGILDGCNHIIFGLYINSTTKPSVGFFGFVDTDGLLCNIGIVNAEITENTDTRTPNTGGLVGSNYGTVSNSYFSGKVSGRFFVGGLVGRNSGTVQNSYAMGSVNGTSHVGGLVGYNSGTVQNSYATGCVGETGGNIGGLVGNNSDGTVSHSFWDTETFGKTTSDGGTGKTTTEMMMQSTFTDAGWDFDDIWWMEEGKTHPLLSWQDESLAGTGNNKLLSNIQWALIISAAAIAMLAVLHMRRKSKPAVAEPPPVTEPPVPVP